MFQWVTSDNVENFFFFLLSCCLIFVLSAVETFLSTFFNYIYNLEKFPSFIRYTLVILHLWMQDVYKMPYVMLLAIVWIVSVFVKYFNAINVFGMVFYNYLSIYTKRTYFKRLIYGIWKLYRKITIAASMKHF